MLRLAAAFLGLAFLAAVFGFGAGIRFLVGMGEITLLHLHRARRAVLRGRRVPMAGVSELSDYFRSQRL